MRKQLHIQKVKNPANSYVRWISFICARIPKAMLSISRTKNISQIDKIGYSAFSLK
jgi:hypothetical protein